MIEVVFVNMNLAILFYLEQKNVEEGKASWAASGDAKLPD